ncbi:MAG: FG-GAP repeat protein [Methanomassiliicoccales archaeon PtaU1.Bin124]|nr:MAG: FG-GAP repeat protein [Methanomassiliicoccales archaeon PtaU1.Bin124]
MSCSKANIRKAKKAVSDIIGNLLILAITVTLFSSVLFFVVNQPAPQNTTYAELQFTQPVNANENFWVNITHKGGQILANETTLIIININTTTPMALRISSSTPSIGSTWTTGETWCYNLGAGYGTSNISATIVDTQTNNIVWQSDLNGGQSSAFSPIISYKGTTPNPAVSGVAPEFYAYVFDPNGDSLTVTLNMTNLGIAGERVMSDSDNDNIYRLTSPAAAAVAWNGKYVEITATDSTGKITKSRLFLSVITSGGGSSSDDFWDRYGQWLVDGTYPPDASGGESSGTDGSFGTSFYYVRNAADYSITRNFNSTTDRILVEFYSDSLQNLAIENTLMVLDSAGKEVKPQTSYSAFGYSGVYGTIYKYTYTFNAPDDSGIYTLRIKLRDNIGTVINLVDNIIINNANTPRLVFYKVNEDNSITQTNSFNHTDTILLRIYTKTTGADITKVGFSDIEIADYSGKYVIKLASITPSVSPADPLWSGAITQIFKTAGMSALRDADSDITTGIYSIQIKPLLATQGWWLSGRNSYSCKISIFTDTDETYEQISKQFNISAPTSTTDIIASVGKGSFTWSASGASWSDNSIAWYSFKEGSSQWQKFVIDDSSYKGPLGMCLTDMDGDGYKDLVVGFQDTAVAVAWYRNMNVDGSVWSNTPTLIASTFDANPGTQAAGGTSKGLADEDTTVWSHYVSPWLGEQSNNFYPSGTTYVCTNEIATAISAGDLDHDGFMDIVVSFVHSVTYSTAGSTGSADYSNSFGMFFNRGIRIYWSASPVDTSTLLYSTNDWITSNNANDNSNPGAMDLAVDDLNNDGWDDIVAVYETGTTKVWLNQFPKQSSADWTTMRTEAFGAGSLITDIPVVDGTTPWGNYADSNRVWPKLELADVNGDTLVDIIRTSSANTKVTIFYTQSNMDAEKIAFVTAESGTALRTNDMNNLKAVDGALEVLSDSFASGVNAPYYAVQTSSDNTGGTIGNLANNDGVYYTVAGVNGNPKKQMNLNFAMTGMTNDATISSVRLYVKYYTGNSYSTSNWLTMVSGGSTTSILQINSLYKSANPYTGYIDLYALGVDTYSELVNLNVYFINSMTSSNSAYSVYFDVVRVEVTFKSWSMDWTYTLANSNVYPNHWLVVNASATSSNLSYTPQFTLQYSSDGTIWTTLGTITSSTGQNYTYKLAASPNANYYVRIKDTQTLANRGGSNFTVSLDMVIVNHSRAVNDPLVVFWTANNRYSDFDFVQPTTNMAASSRITCIAVGDVGTYTSDPSRVDGLKDIVIGTTDTDGVGTLYVAIHKIGAFVTPTEIPTTALATKVGSNTAIFRTTDVEIGDFNGDKYTDIVLMIGYNFGRQESNPTTPTIWVYTNQANPTSIQFTEQALNAMVTGESGINVETGNVDLSILLPFASLIGIPAAVVILDRKEKKGKK